MKLKALLQRMIVSSDLKDLAEKHRLDISIPEDGFDSCEEFDVWSKNFSEEEILENFNGFFFEAVKIVPYQKVLSRKGFIRILYDYYYHLREFNIEVLTEEFTNDMYDILTVSDKKGAGKKVDIPKGVYIRIPPTSTSTEIKSFVKDFSTEIKQAQESFSKKLGYRDLDIGDWREFGRDKYIARLYKFPINILEEHFGVKKIQGQYKSQFIANILMKDPESGNISEEAVDKAIKRFKNREKWVGDT